MQVHLALLMLFQGYFWYFCRFWELQPSFQAWFRIGAEFCEFSAISSSRDEEMSSGSEETEAELMQERMEECRIFAMALRKFRKDCENFATIEKISQSLRNFAMHIFSL